jgi:hypothetical protein
MSYHLLEIQRSGFDFKSNHTSAIGNLANRNIWQAMFPAIMPWPMKILPFSVISKHFIHVKAVSLHWRAALVVALRMACK